MQAQRTNGVVVRGAGEGPATWAMGSLFERLASGRETGGTFDLTLATQPPGIAPPLHVHTPRGGSLLRTRGDDGLPGRRQTSPPGCRIVHLPSTWRSARLPDHRNNAGAIPEHRFPSRTDGPVRRGRHASDRAQAAWGRWLFDRRRDPSLERDQPAVRPASRRSPDFRRHLKAPTWLYRGMPSEPRPDGQRRVG